MRRIHNEQAEEHKKRIETKRKKSPLDCADDDLFVKYTHKKNIFFSYEINGESCKKEFPIFLLFFSFVHLLLLLLFFYYSYWYLASMLFTSLLTEDNNFFLHFAFSFLLYIFAVAKSCVCLCVYLCINWRTTRKLYTAITHIVCLCVQKQTRHTVRCCSVWRNGLGISRQPKPKNDELQSRFNVFSLTGSLRSFGKRWWVFYFATRGTKNCR